jgi:hypothetical protein
MPQRAKPITQAGGTSLVEPAPSRAWLAALVIVTPVVAYLVHRLGAGSDLGWDYDSAGGAGRSIITLSIVSGLAAGGFAAGYVAKRAARPTFATWLGLAALATVALGTYAAKQFEDYRTAGTRIMDEPMCTFVNEKLMSCVEQVWGPKDAAIVRRAQHGCRAADSEIATYTKCMPIQDCNQLVECIAHP